MLHYEESLKSGIKEFFFDAHGRFSRETFTVALSVLSLLSIVTVPLLVKIFGFFLPKFLYGCIGLIYAVYLFYAYFVICIKRLHDLNLTGWLSVFLIFLYPLSIPFFAYLVVQKGKQRDNKYGQSLNYTGPSLILKASYAFLILSAITTVVSIYFAFYGQRILNSGQNAQKVIANLPFAGKKLKQELKNNPRAMGTIFIDNQFTTLAVPIAKDRVLVIGDKGISNRLSAGKKAEIRFSDNSVANVTRLLVSNPDSQMFVFLIDPPIGTPGEIMEGDKKLLDEMGAFQ